MEYKFAPGDRVKVISCFPNVSENEMRTNGYKIGSECKVAYPLAGSSASSYRGPEYRMINTRGEQIYYAKEINLAPIDLRKELYETYSII